MKQKLLIFTIVLLLTAPFFVHAAGLVPCGGPTEKPCTVLDLFYGVARVTNWLIAMAGLYAVYQVVNHSFWLAISMGNEEDITKRKSALKSVFIGLFVVFGAYMFVNTAVNILLMSKCKIDFAQPWTYVTLANPSTCVSATPNSQNYNGYNEYNAQGGIVPGGK